METEPLRSDRDDRGCGASDAGQLHGGEGEKHLCQPLAGEACGLPGLGYGVGANNHRRL